MEYKQTRRCWKLKLEIAGLKYMNIKTEQKQLNKMKTRFSYGISRQTKPKNLRGLRRPEHERKGR